MLTELQKVHDALGCPKMIYPPWHSILLPTFEYMTKIFFVFHATTWHSTQKCNMVCNTIYFFNSCTNKLYLDSTNKNIFFVHHLDSIRTIHMDSNTTLYLPTYKNNSQ